MLKRLKDNFDAGIEKIKWYSSFVSERLKVEISLIKLLQDRSKKEKERTEKLIVIGERVCELMRHSERDILKDKIIIDALQGIEKIDAEIEDIKKKTSEISKVEV